MRRSRGTTDFKLSDFEFEDELGRGGFGVVRKAHWKEKNMDVAIKEINSNQRSEQLRLEVENHKSISHENVVKFYGYFKESGKDYIVMELCKEGSLRSYIKKQGALTEEQARSTMYHLVNALEHLHSKGICHRDLTAGNVLIHKIRTNTVFVKVCDFGLAKVMNQGRAAHTMAGTPGYMDPQVANYKNYGMEVDVYSLGCVLYTMLTGYEPKHDQTRKFPNLHDLDDNAIQLFESLIDPNLKNRIKLDKVKLTPFMREVNGRSSISDRPTSIHSIQRRDHRSIERKSSIDQLAIRDRSQSMGAVRERNRSPSISSRQLISRPRSTSRVRVSPFEGLPWPINFNRLASKKEESKGYLLAIMNEGEAVLSDSKDGNEIMRIHLTGRNQKIIFRSSSRPYTSIEQLSEQHLVHYKMVVSLLEDIRWKVAKVIFNNSSICKGGVIRLMENGDLRVKDEKGKLYSVRRGSDTVYEGDPRNPTGPVRCPIKKEEIIFFLDLCLGVEATMEKRSKKFPFISYDITDDTKTVNRNAREAMGETNRVATSTGIGRNPISQGISQQRVSKEIKSSRSHVRNPSEDAMVTNWSAPPRSRYTSEKENEKPTVTFLKNRSGEVQGIKMNSTSLRISQTTPNQYIYTASDGIADRFSFTGKNYESIRDKTKAYLLQKLIDRR